MLLIWTECSYVVRHNVTDMSFMFTSCNSLEALDIAHFNASKVTNAHYMIESCYKLKNLDINKSVGRFNEELMLEGVWKNIVNGQIYDANNAQNKKMKLTSGLYVRLK